MMSEMGRYCCTVFLGSRTKILRAADAFYARRREGPYRFIQNRSRTSVVALKSDAAAEKSKDQLSRDFPGRSIFDFCNNICQKRTQVGWFSPDLVKSFPGNIGSSPQSLIQLAAFLAQRIGQAEPQLLGSLAADILTDLRSLLCNRRL